DGARYPLTFRTNCSAAARTSSSPARSSGRRRVTMLRHIYSTYFTLVVDKTAAGCGLHTIVIDPSCGENSVSTVVPVLKLIVPRALATHGPRVADLLGMFTVTGGLFLGSSLIGPKTSGVF